MYDMDLPRLVEQFRSEEKCRAYLEALRWPEKVSCPRCASVKISRIVSRSQFDCDSCRYQFSVTAGTIFHDSHLPIWKWLLATYMMAEAKKGVSANQLKRTLAVSYKTAWYLCHRIRAAMKDANTIPLDGIVEVDETFVGGKRSGVGRGRKVRKMVVIGAADRDDGTIHVRADVHTNTIEGVWSLFKRGLVGSYHQLSTKHLPAYLDETAFRYNNRKNPYLFRDTVLRLLDAKVLSFRKLVAKG